ncbi:MAG: SecDF P1 head subdomain-containing protein [Planctomycetota bacterium]|jgi:hypothetical protein
MWRNQGKLLGLLIVVLVVSSGDGLLAQQLQSWTMELRIAASPTEDVKIAQAAKEVAHKELHFDGELVAKWVPILKRKAESCLNNPHLVTRKIDNGRVELLVLVGDDDITEQYVRAIASERDRFGQFALGVRLDDPGSAKLRRLSSNNLSTDSRVRHAAVIMDGKVYGAAELVAALSDGFQITGDFTESTIDSIATRAGGKVKRVYYTPPAGSITIYPWHLAAGAVILPVVLLGLLPARGLTPSKHPRLWISAGIIVGAIVGAHQLGVSVSYGTADIGGGLSAIEESINISLLWVFLGGVTGAGAGAIVGLLSKFLVRRAIYSAGRLFSRIRTYGP